VSAPSADERLRQIQLVTDAALARLSLDDLLVEILHRVRDILAVDTAVVLLLDAGSGRFVTTAALGIEQVRRRDRLLEGPFAAQVLRSRGPQVIDRLEQSAAVSPALRARGVTSLLGVPLMAAGATIGVLHVGTLAHRRFGPADAELLQLAADRIALAAQARLAQSEQEAARALTASLIPDRLPAIEGLDLAARYLPTEQGAVGGDWYDVFQRPGGEWCFAMGDVAGHGFKAAVVMGRMRSVLRAYAFDHEDPAEVLQRLDRKIQHFEPGAMATVSYAVFDPDPGRLRLSLAGHFPPIVAEPGRPVVIANVPGDPPIGAAPGLRRRTTALSVPPGAVLLFFTDGLIERRSSAIDVDLERLRSLVTADEPAALCDTVIGELLGSEPTNDDVAVLAIRRTAV
jgi:serine phosphatase RsbU (regulator of sigma subunit)